METVLVSLRQIEESDLSMIQAWRNNEEVRAYTREYRYLTLEDQRKWYKNQSCRTSDWDQELMILNHNVPNPKSNEASCIPIGVAGFTRIQWRNRRAEISFYIGEDRYRDKAHINAGLRLILNRGFNEWGFHKITWPVYDHDPNLQHYITVIPVECALQEEYFWDGKFQVRWYLSIINKNDSKT